MTKFIKKGDTYHPTSGDNLIVTDYLPLGTYTVRFAPDAGFFLQKINDYDAPAKLYGDAERKATRILNTFIERNGATGVLLSGEKGCGKSMLAKLLSLRGAERNFPTIVINQAWHGEVFNGFMQSINQPTIILFDEFEKIYHEKEAQEAMLTLLDGVYPTNKLFVLTTNDKYGINRHMLNRPGRLFYNIEYAGLSEIFIKEYCLDKLSDAAQVQSICTYSQAFESFNFDMLKALVEEMNRYGESLQDAVSMLNIKAEAFTQKFSVKITINGKAPYWIEEHITINPLQEFDIEYALTKVDVDNSDEHYQCIRPADLHSIKNGTYIYEKIVGNEVFKVVLSKAPYTGVDYNKLSLVA